MDLPFQNRIKAGQRLADALKEYAGRSDVLVLGLPRGGVPVAAEVARSLGAELDLIVVRKLGTPGQEELAMGAIASGGAKVLNEELIQQLNISEKTIDKVTTKERKELQRREQAYRGDRPDPQLRDRQVILIDDGIATGATMRSAVKALKQQGPARLIVAVPVAPPDTVEALRREADEVVCLATPEPFWGVGRWYEDFAQTTDDEVRQILAEFWKE